MEICRDLLQMLVLPLEILCYQAMMNALDSSIFINSFQLSKNFVTIGFNQIPI